MSTQLSPQLAHGGLPALEAGFTLLHLFKPAAEHVSMPVGDPPPSSTRLQPCSALPVGGWTGPALPDPNAPRPVHRRKKLIEVAIPLEAINAASAREKSIRHGHPSTLHLWWAYVLLLVLAGPAGAARFLSVWDDYTINPVHGGKSWRPEAGPSRAPRLQTSKLADEGGQLLPQLHQADSAKVRQRDAHTTWKGPGGHLHKGRDHRSLEAST